MLAGCSLVAVLLIFGSTLMLGIRVHMMQWGVEFGWEEGGGMLSISLSPWTCNPASSGHHRGWSALWTALELCPSFVDFCLSGYAWKGSFVPIHCVHMGSCWTHSMEVHANIPLPSDGALGGKETAQIYAPGINHKAVLVTLKQFH